MVPKRDWFASDGPWWSPYAGVACGAVVAALLLLMFLLTNAAEIARLALPFGR
jgi:hypothetical protein